MELQPQPITNPDYVPLEQDEQGCIFGYKIMVYLFKEDVYLSPVYPTAWIDDQLVSDSLPSLTNFQDMHGIHMFKSPRQPSLLHDLEFYHTLPRSTDSEMRLVRCAAYGDVVVENQWGLRAHKAKLISRIPYLVDSGFYKDHYLLYQYYALSNPEKPNINITIENREEPLHHEHR